MLALIKLLSMQSKRDFIHVYIVRIDINIFCFLNSTTKPFCNNIWVLNLKFRDTLTKKEKDVNEEA